ncbi:putative repair and recombination protein UvsY [Erwinia phage phiEa2809]|uniref:Putative repair and recombination protein UvsY n=1 Tax=Erwinia phage phiEa2809 TaxID=1564096 RepID=A0A0A0YR89_9CAUD|nr:UvsY-like recombination mediator [Erwinia phage phiEa2809]AIX13107.1 putative repair and recombination protein UvsY [Erwinia phage phiEa2809]
MADNEEIPLQEIAGIKVIPIEYIMEVMDRYFAIDPYDKNLDQISLRCGRAFSQAQKFYLNEGRGLEKFTAKRNQVEVQRRLYYLGQLPAAFYQKEPLPRPVLKTDVELYLKADSVLQEISALVEEQKRKVKYLESCFDRIRSMGYEVKNAIEWRKYMDGG